ncbi:MAG: Na+:solute symporter [Melioribacteraceae bacterium]|nr:Na+:solute symporter [Melioribacteraceae bacterium]MCF8353474.1 Na+:solute symporter [Melioribacteraceae bacterium]MCF8392603.1 Na+:solute symporter [Melioribacteraceae bacterium]MCF8418525.1 Na+:solute symporter [Melioribacteraceae bacterium]
MQVIDYIIIAVYFIISIVIALYYSKRAGKSTDDFFLSGRNLPWYLAGISLVATTFAADTPLAVTELVAKNGIAGNWIWWNFAFGGLLTVFFFARLWRRAGIMTEAEFSEIRYSGKPAKFLRGFRAVYLGLFMNVIIIGWVNRAMVSILIGLFGLGETDAILFVFGAMILVAIYSAISGLWGVVITDVFQFVIAMTGCIILAVLVINSPQVGGIEGLKNNLPDFMFNFFPQISLEASEFGSAFALSVTGFLAYVGVQWWASWYPGAEPGGGGYTAQRMLAAKDEKHSLFATLFFQIAHYALRPWPWIIVGLASLIIYPDLAFEDKGLGYIYAMNDFLPVGLKGLLVAAFFGAYMSTIATHLNWGSSYLLNDVYRRFFVKSKTEKHYVLASRLITILIMLISILVTLQISRISGAWEFILQCGAGLGLVLIMRWYWWRINAWSEITAMITPFVFYPVLLSLDVEFPVSLFYLVAVTSVVWISITYLTKPVDDETLKSFYEKIKPGGILWKPVREKFSIPDSKTGFLRMFFNWFLGVVLVYTSLFSIGSFVFLNIIEGLIYLGIGTVSAVVIYINLKTIDWQFISQKNDI